MLFYENAPNAARDDFALGTAAAVPGKQDRPPSCSTLAKRKSPGPSPSMAAAYRPGLVACVGIPEGTGGYKPDGTAMDR